MNNMAQSAYFSPSFSKINGTLNLTPTGSPSVASQQKIDADLGTLRAYGYVGDGASHPLSSVTTFNGMSTAGWTLATWQHFLPAAQAQDLSDEIDWAATQSYIRNAAKPTSIHLPPGTGVFNKALTVCEQTVAFYGEGGINQAGGSTGTTTLEFTGGTDGIVHCATAASGQTPASKIELHDLKLVSTTLTGSIVGVRDQTANNTLLQNVSISGFNNGVNFFNPRGTLLSKVVLSAGQAAGVTAVGTSTGVYYRGTQSFVNHMYSVLTQGFELGYAFISQTGGGQGIEDLQVVNSACGGENRCIVIDSEDPNYGPFNYSFTNMSVNVVSQFASLPTALDVVFIGGNWLVNAKPSVPGGSGNQWLGGMNLYDIGNATGKSAHMIHIGNQFVGDGEAVNFNALLAVGSGGDDVTFRDNHIETSGMMPALGYIYPNGLANHVVEDNTDWRMHFRSISPPANAVVYGGGAASVSSRFYSVSVGVPTLSACGTSPILQPGSNNVDGIITEGSGNPTGCKLSFAAPLRSIKPPCVVQNTIGGIPFNLSTLDQTGFSLTHSAAPLTFTYHCRADW